MKDLLRIYFWSIKTSDEVLLGISTRATSLSTYDFPSLYTTLPHNLINAKII